MPPTEKPRCAWATSPAMNDYHDTEWGVPTHDERRHFEFMILEGAQAGLSWKTILDKRAGYRRNFAEFDPVKVARFTPAKIEKILTDPGVVRNRQKVESAVSNAKLFLGVAKEHGSFDAFMWSFVGEKPIVNQWREMTQVPPTSPQSDAMAAAMKKLGFKFCGSTILYAHMQACGLVNDHLTTCFRYKECQ